MMLSGTFDRARASAQLVDGSAVQICSSCNSSRGGCDTSISELYFWRRCQLPCHGFDCGFDMVSKFNSSWPPVRRWSQRWSPADLWLSVPTHADKSFKLKIDKKTKINPHGPAKVRTFRVKQLKGIWDGAVETKFLSWFKTRILENIGTIDSQKVIAIRRLFQIFKWTNMLCHCKQQCYISKSWISATSSHLKHTHTGMPYDSLLNYA